MEEIDKYNKMLKDLNNKYSSYTEVDNRVDVKPEWSESDIVVCVNNNFVEDDETHGSKDGLSLGKIYKVLSIRDGQMIIIRNDFYEDAPYFNWRFFKVPRVENFN